MNNMKKENTLCFRRTTLHLVILYLLFTGVRVLLAFTQSVNPFIMGDEGLYINLAKSLWHSHDLLMRGQPVNYPSFLYSILLAPLAALPYAVDLHRAIQVLNCLVMNACLFPVWHLTCLVTKSKKSSWLIVILSLMMPSAAITEVVMSDGLISLFSALAFYCMYKSFQDNKLKDALLTVLFASLLFFLKPGYIVVGIVYCVVLLIKVIKTKEYKNAGSLVPIVPRVTIVPIVTFIVVCLIIYWLPHLAAAKSDAAGVYQNLQDAAAQGGWYNGFFGIILYAFLFSAGFLVVPAVLIISNQSKMEAGKRYWIISVMVSLVLMTLGVCFSIYLNEYTGEPFVSRVHLRYLSFYYILLLIYLLSLDLRNFSKLRLIIFTIIWCNGFLLIKPAAGIISHYADSLNLSVLYKNAGLGVSKEFAVFCLVATVIVLVLMLLKYGWTKLTKQAYFSIFILFLLISNYAGYHEMVYNHSKEIKADARETGEWMDHQIALVIAEDATYFWEKNSTLDMHARKQIESVELHDLLANLDDNGAYKPFIPKHYWYDTPGFNTPDAEYFVFNAEVLDHTVVYDYDSIRYSTNRTYAILPVYPDKPVIHSAIYNLGDYSKIENANFEVFDANLLQNDYLKLSLTTKIYEDAAYILNLNDTQYTITLTQNLVEFVFPVPEKGKPVIISLSSDGFVYCDGYYIEPFFY
ncbi:hypothetical protein FACS189423_01360 [Bacteroidia bacterium]|nr:hypothetical protein FACS189423_01360 [Bacteroidia bacterium]